MKRAAVVLVALLAAGCSSLPPTPIFSTDVCHRCHRVIADTKLAGEIIDSYGRAFKFKTAGCMAKFVAEKNPDAAAIYVTDIQSGRLVKATAVTFVPTMMGEGWQRSLDYLAFSSDKLARAAAARENTTPLDWKKLVETARATN